MQTYYIETLIITILLLLLLLLLLFILLFILLSLLLLFVDPMDCAHMSLSYPLLLGFFKGPVKGFLPTERRVSTIFWKEAFKDLTSTSTSLPTSSLNRSLLAPFLTPTLSFLLPIPRMSFSGISSFEPFQALPHHRSLFKHSSLSQFLVSPLSDASTGHPTQQFYLPFSSQGIWGVL